MEKTERILCSFDIDSFFPSVFKRDNPQYADQPVAISEGARRSVVASACYIARKFGVKNAMSAMEAKQLCPHIVFGNPSFEVYREASSIMFEIVSRHSDSYEKVGIDEGYMDLTERSGGTFDGAVTICEAIRKEMYDKTQLTLSFGISVNKFIAKVSCGMNKPRGMTVITQEAVDGFLMDLTIDEFRGVGPKTAELFREYNIRKGSDLHKLSYIQLSNLVGESRGLWFYNVVRGIDDRQIETSYDRKSLNIHKTFSKDIKKGKDAARELMEIAREMEERLTAKGFYGKTLTVKARYVDFSMVTRSITNGNYFRNHEEIFHTVIDLLKSKPLLFPVRMLGMSVSKLESTELQLW